MCNAKGYYVMRKSGDDIKSCITVAFIAHTKAYLDKAMEKGKAVAKHGIRTGQSDNERVDNKDKQNRHGQGLDKSLTKRRPTAPGPQRGQSGHTDPDKAWTRTGRGY